MADSTRRQFLTSGMAAATSLAAWPAHAVWKGNMSDYTVRDPLAGYFDLDERRRIATELPNIPVTQARLRAMKAPNHDKVMAIPVQHQTIDIPPFYEKNAEWRIAVAPFRDFEDAVSNLAAANLVAPNDGHADCLIDLLVQWAELNALAKFNYSKQYRQGWFQVESTLFAIGHALAAVRPDILHREDELHLIDTWLNRTSRLHFAETGQPGGTCCNNHYYRRAVHAAMIGVVTNDNRLFRQGVGAVYSALTGATHEGALPLELKRGPLAAHYQNYAAMYLAMIAEIATRQGYPLWELEIDGKSLHTLIEFNNKIMADPNFVLAYSGADEVSLKYRKDKQYFAWYELYLARYQNAQMAEWIKDKRPLYNRSLGGHMTLYFYPGVKEG